MNHERHGRGEALVECFSSPSVVEFSSGEHVIAGVPRCLTRSVGETLSTLGSVAETRRCAVRWAGIVFGIVPEARPPRVVIGDPRSHVWGEQVHVGQVRK